MPDAVRHIARGAASVALVASLLLVSGTPAWAAGGTAAMSDGRMLGIFSAALLLVLLGCAYLVCLRALLREPQSLLWPVLILLAIALIKVAALPLLPGLGIDVGSYQAWALRVTEVGPARTYAPDYFLDYPPGYLYALWLAGTLVHALGAGGEVQRMIVESPALVADLLLAIQVFAFIRRSAPSFWAYAGMLLVALNPALLFDTVIWGQSDSVPALLIFLSVVLILDSEYELSWALAAMAALVKPQALMLLPVLGLWTVLKGRLGDWMRSALAFLAVGVIVAAPFQIGHDWTWLWSLYRSTAAYYHETSVNAFNLMALAGGLRQPDSGTVLGATWFTLGMGLLGAVYVFVGYLLWRKPSEKVLIFSVFFALFESFMVAPRMHERYLYPALVLLVPAALGASGRWKGVLLGALAALSATFLFNLAYVKHILEANIFLEPHDALATVASIVNLVAFAAVIAYALGLLKPERAEEPAASAPWPVLERLRAAALKPAPIEPEKVKALPWARADTILLTTLTTVAAATRFWRIWFPAEIVFDEVHFVGQARHYLHGESFLDPHPPLGKLLIALSIGVFGDHPWSWRIPNAILGTALVAITYLLGRRLFASRLAAALAAAFVLGDGMFLVDSRIAVLDIVYLTFAAWAYLTLFQFAATTDVSARRRALVLMGIALGLCLGSKLYVPAVTFLLVAGFVIWILLREAAAAPAVGRSRRTIPDGHARAGRAGGALALVGGLAAMVYLAIFLPHFVLGWWGGIADLLNYYGQVVWYERSVSSATHPYAAPWWSWPLLLRPIAYWQNFPATGNVATIWGGGNPALWWGALTGISIVAIQAMERRSLSRTFLVAGYLSYLLIWVPIGRTLFLYHYMPSVYLGFLALAGVLAECWNDRAQLFEHLALILTLAPVCVLGLGAGPGTVVFLAIVAAYAALLARTNYAGKWVCLSFAAAAFVLFIYFFPIWIGLPIQRAGYYARMWLQGPGLRSWI